MITLTHIEINKETPFHRPEQYIQVNPKYIRTIRRATDGECKFIEAHTVITMGRQTILVKEMPPEINDKIEAAK